MKYYLPAVILLALQSLSINAQKTKTAADYDRAISMLAPATMRLVDNAANPGWTPDGRLLYGHTEGENRYSVYDPQSRKTQNIRTMAEVMGQNPSVNWGVAGVVSPDGKKIAYISNYNLWMKTSDGANPVQLTTDGIKDYGYATDNAGWTHSDNAILMWSPNSDKISTFRQDQRHLKDMYLVRTKVGHPQLEQWKYPLPGDSAVAKIERVIIDLTQPANPKLIRLKMPADDHRGTLSDDISSSGTFDDNSWSADGKELAFVSTSRDHKQANLRIANAETGDVRDVLEEKVATQYESGQGAINWKYLSKSNEIIWYSERSDWAHLYLYDARSGKLKNPITTGNFVVTQVLHVDEAARVIFFMANGREAGRNPYFSHLYRVDFSGKNLKLLSPGNGTHTIKFSPDKKWFADTYSQPDVPEVTELRSAKDGSLASTIARMDISKLSATGWKAPTTFTVKSADNRFDLYGLYFTPTKMEPGKKYPVVVYIYPGPQGGSVGRWGFSSARGDHQALAELGFVVVLLEGSCNPGRSKSFHDACYGDFSVNTLPDQISGLKQLQDRLGFLDLDKVGIWGHSGGGFATAAAMFRYPDFFKVGISESGNHDNRNYEDDWGERYVGLLNGDNYEKQANQLYAKNLKGKLLIAHGNMDDNVPPYNSYLVVDALVKANKDFDLIIFPNARHGFGEDSYYMMRRRWDYFVKNLQGAEPPKEYKITFKK